MSASNPISESSHRLTLKVTDIKLRVVENGTDGLVAWASCVISGAVKLENIAIRRGRNGKLFLTYPAKRTSSGSKFHYFKPISAEAAQAVEDAVMARLAALAKGIRTAHGKEQGPSV